jgi:hypothetical protein
MKQKDIAVIIIVAFISAIASFVISGKIFVAQKNQQQVEVIDHISADFEQPDSKYFNTSSVDPTQLVQIGENTNETPFNSTAQ